MINQELVANQPYSCELRSVNHCCPSPKELLAGTMQVRSGRCAVFMPRHHSNGSMRGIEIGYSIQFGH